jgi:hypothetical protein
MVANAKESGNIDEAEYKVTTKEYIALALLLLLLLLLLHLILYTSYYSSFILYSIRGIYIYRQAIQYDATAMTAAAPSRTRYLLDIDISFCCFNFFLRHLTDIF